MTATAFIRAKVIRIFLIACALLMATGTLSAANLHLFLVGDYDSSELLPALKFDIANLRREAREISSNTGLKIIETILVGSEARTATVLAKLKALNAGSNDVIFFYFTGHGFRMPSKGIDPWPFMYFAKEHKAIDFSEVHEIISRKNVRLRILIIDGCNNVLTENSVPTVKNVIYSSSLTRLVRDNYRKLFLDSEGTISMAACQPGQTSLALKNGSLYTLSFLQCLHVAVKKKGNFLDWQGLLDETTDMAIAWAIAINEEQHPIFLIEP